MGFPFPGYSLHSLIFLFVCLYNIYWAVGGFTETDERILLSGWGWKGQETYTSDKPVENTSDGQDGGPGHSGTGVRGKSMVGPEWDK